MHGAEPDADESTQSTSSDLDQNATEGTAVEDARSRRFVAVFDEHHDQVWRTLRRLGVSDAQADDATQNVFIVVARRLDEIHAGEEARFLYGVALRVASEFRRRDPACRRLADEHVLATLSDEAPGAEEQLIEREARAALDEALEGMPDDLREVLVLVELDGISVPLLAEILGVPVGTASSRLRRAREAFTQSAPRVRARLAGGKR